MLWAFYDLAVSAATFDIVHFLGLADAHRERTKCTGLHMTVVPGPKEGFRDDDFTPYNTENKRWRLNNIIIPCCWLVPSCKQITVASSREDPLLLEMAKKKNVFPEGYSVEKPRENYRLAHLVAATNIPGIRSSPYARRIIRNWIKKKAGRRKVVTIDLRETSYQQDRNSSLSDWTAFAHSLDKNIFLPVIIRDVETVHNEISSDLEGLMMYPEVIWNVDLRTALYELSYMSLFVNHGPAALSRLNRYSRSLTFKMITPTVYPTTEKYFRSNGLEPGDQIQSVSAFHRIVWAEDTFDTICKEFYDMCRRIDQAPGEAGIVQSDGKDQT